jgi:hypothetical protein
MRFEFLRRTARPLLASFIFAATLGPAAPGASAQDAPQPNTQSQEQTQQTQTQTPTQTQTQTSTPTPQQPAPAPPAEAPLYTDFKGVKIGTSRDEARKKLGRPQEKDDSQDFFALSDRERARLYYDEKGAVTAIIVTHLGKSDDIPTPKAILGADLEPKQDGSMYRIVYYPKAGYWVAYSRTPGDEPLTMITMQKMHTKSR